MSLVRIISWLNRPFPFYDEWVSLGRQAVLAGFFVTFFLFAFKPFGLHEFNDSMWPLLWISIQYGLITFFVAALSGLVAKALPQYFNDQKWTVGREILHSLAFVAAIALANLIFSAWKYQYSITLKIYLLWLGVTAAVGMFPTIVGVALKQARLARQYTAEAASINTELPAPKPVASTTTLTLLGDNQGESLRLSLDALLYIESADNYVTVYWRDGHTQRATLLRGTLKRFESDLAGYPMLYRCHRAYIVHLGHVVRLSGNAQGYKLHLADTDAQVPVSRSLNEDIRARFAHL
jgi:LytTr DNA-binding domain